MGWIYTGAGGPETRQRIIAALEQEGYTHNEEDRILEPVYLIGFNRAEKSYTFIHTVMGAAAAASSRIVIENEEFLERIKPR